MSLNSQPFENYNKISPEILIDVEKVLKKLGLSMDAAINIYLEEIAKTGRLPFELPNNETLKALEDLRSKKNCKTFTSIDDLMEDLND